jgi:hypothetical protein
MHVKIVVKNGKIVYIKLWKIFPSKKSHSFFLNEYLLIYDIEFEQVSINKSKNIQKKLHIKKRISKSISSSN